METEGEAMRFNGIDQTEAWIFFLAVIAFMVLAFIVQYVRHKLRMAYYWSVIDECSNSVNDMLTDIRSNRQDR